MNQKTCMRIIVIDDNPEVHQDFKKILMASKKGHVTDTEKVFPEFEIDSALYGDEGIKKIKTAVQHDQAYSMVFVDLRKDSDWDRIETIHKIWEVDPNIQVVLCSTFSDYSWEHTLEQLDHNDNLLILRKPFDNITIKQIANALTKKWQQESKTYTSELEAQINQRTESLEKSLSLMRATLESSADGVLVVDNDGNIIDSNSKFNDMWHLPAAVTDAKSFKQFAKYVTSNIEDSQDFLSRMRKLERKSDLIIEGILTFKNGKVFEYYTQIYSLNDKMIGRVWSFRDITKRVLLEQELQYQATHDLLTGLPNRVLLLDRIKQSMAKADRNKTSFAILFMDLDRFKLINDSLSHEAGDEILRAVALRLSTQLREEDTYARLGGDEFVIVINDVVENRELIDVAYKLLSVFEQPFEIYGHQFTLSTSVGIAIYPKDGEQIDVLLRNADTAMYRAKELGSNQFQFYTEELNTRNMIRLETESELRQAIANNEFFLTYQPQYDLVTSRFVSVEALIRWNHPKKGVVLPLDFIPIAEDSGLIVPIGEWVLRTACKQLKAWIDKGLPPIRVAVNISTKQFKLYDLKQSIANILEETGLQPQYLEIEVTENILINNVDIIQTIKELKAMGVQIVLDDFGTGYSSLNYLRELPVDRLKIDQSYVQNFDANKGDDIIIQAIIAMANSLNMDVMAEGVETQKQLDFLKNTRCNEAQGYFFSRPISPDECEQLLRTNAKIEEPV